MGTSKDILHERITDLENMLNNAYMVVEWPESQDFIGRNDCYLINDDNGVKDFGSSAYFVPINIYNLVINQNAEL